MIWKPRKANEYASIHFTPHSLELHLIKRNLSPKKPYEFELITSLSCLLEKKEYCEGKIFNHATIGNIIRKFLTRHKKTAIPVMFFIHGEHIIEKQISCQSLQPQIDILNVDNKNFIFDYCYLYPLEDNTHSFYACAIERALITQYQLLAIKNKINIQVIATPTIGHLNLYKYLEDTDFSTLKLAKNLQANPAIARLISQERVQTVASYNQFSSESCYDQFNAALGGIIMHEQSQISLGQ